MFYSNIIETSINKLQSSLMLFIQSDLEVGTTRYIGKMLKSRKVIIIEMNPFLKYI